MEALEKDFEDFIDAEEEVLSEEEILAEDEVWAEDLSESELEEIKAFAEEEDLDYEDIQLVLDEEGNVVELVKKKQRTKAELDKDAGGSGARKKALRDRRIAYSKDKGAQADAKRYNRKTKNKKPKFSFIKRGVDAVKKALGKKEEFVFDSSNLESIRDLDLSEEDFDIYDEIVADTPEFMTEDEFLAFSLELIEDEDLDHLSEDQLEEGRAARLKKAAKNRLLKAKLGIEPGSGWKLVGGKKVKIEPKIFRQMMIAAKKRGKKSKGKKKRRRTNSFNPFIDSDGNEVQLASYDASQDVTALVGDTELSEEFKEKATTIFEAAVGRQVEVHVEFLKESYASQLEEAVEVEKEDIVEQVDSYLDYVTSEYVQDNKMEIESGIRSELTESFISEMKNVFEKHYIDIPETKVDVLVELSERVNQLETQLDEEISSNVELKQTVSSFTKDDCVNTLSGGLTDTETEQLRDLSQGLEFDGDKEDFVSKVKTLKEQYFPKSVGKSGELDADEEVEIADGQVSDVMQAYTSALTRTVKTQ